MNENSDTGKDGQLIDQARSNPSAFARLYRKHYDAVFRYCVHRLFERQLAEDVTSLVFLSVVENFHRFKGDEQDFRNWLYTIATNTVNATLRKSARRNDLLKRANEQPSGENSADESSEKAALLQKAILTLRPRYQTIITLRFFENLRLTEIAEVLGSRPGTVRSQLKRALYKLRKKIAFEQEV